MLHVLLPGKGEVLLSADVSVSSSPAAAVPGSSLIVLHVPVSWEEQQS